MPLKTHVIWPSWRKEFQVIWLEGPSLPLRTMDAIGVPTGLKPQPWKLRPRLEKGVLSRTQN